MVYLDTDRKLWNDYKIWIMRHELGAPAKTCADYSDLLSFLHDCDFFPPTPRDAARAEDGLEMRVIFLEQNNIEDVMFHHNPKVLEVLAALSQRIELEYVGDPSNPEPYKIFFDIIKNHLKILHGPERNIYDWMDGNRPLFITARRPYKCDIWSQMQMYIHENYK